MMQTRTNLILLALVLLANASNESAGANPIRKVVTLMQNMQKEIATEGEKEKELFDKFMCFCGGSSSDLEQSASNSRNKIDELTSKLESEKSEKTQVEQDLIQHKKDRQGAKSDIAEATALREKEHAEFEEMSADSKINIEAMAGAIPALEAGMGAAALMQMPHIDRVHLLVQNLPDVPAVDRRNVIAFLDQTGDYVPQGGQIVGILKQMKDQLESELKTATADEDGAGATFEQLKSSKEEEIKLASRAIETKMVRSGELAVAAIQTKDAVKDEKEELADAEQFSGNLKEQCATKEKEWDERVKVRNSEIEAIGEAINILNDDEALDTFKKTLPSGGAGASFLQGSAFLQKRRSGASTIRKAQVLLARMASQHSNPQYGLMLFTLNSKIKLQQHGGMENFDEVVEMVDGMVALLKKQQVEDDEKKDACIKKINDAHVEEKAATGAIADFSATIDEMSDSVAQLAEQIASLVAENAALDKDVAEATEQRKAEHAEYAENLQMNDVAKKLVEKAKNGLQKFYNPSLYKAPVESAMVQTDDAILSRGTSFLQVSVRGGVAPPETPETFSGSVKPNKASTGVLAMMDEIITDLDKTILEARMDENSSQKGYGKLMGDSQQTRAENAKSITNKQAAKAELGAKLGSAKQSHRDAKEDLNIVQSLIDSIHGECDFLLGNYDMRKEARAAELESLGNAKSVLQGANFGF